jgi:NADPH2:quinone reductase
MKAVVCRAYGPPESLLVEDLPTPVPGAGQVLVEVKAAGVNFPDSLIIQDKYQLKPPLPFSPGSELAGVAKALGEGVTRYRVGQPVIGFTGWGAYAQAVVVPQERLIPMPEGMPFDVAGSFVMTYGTCWHALKDRAALQPGETVLVLGAAGGIGLASVEIAKALGAGAVIAAASSDDKLAVCREHGADHVINYTTEDLRERLKAIVGAGGVDVVCDPVGGRYAEAALRSTAWRGRYLVLGFADGEIPKIPLNLPLLKGNALVGVFWGEFVRREPARAASDLQALMALYREGKIRPLVYRRYPLEQAADALYALLKREVKGKAVIVP